MKVNVKEKNPLCRSCEHSTLVHTNVTGLAYAYCCQMSTKLNELPTQCSGWSSFLEEEPYNMVRKAWILEVKGRQIIGFKPPKRGKDE